jgi:hypothetical protein
MKLEVGQFVRIKNKAGWCCIGKLYNINDFREPSMKYCIDIQSDDFIFVPEDMIIKASHNIIDLIEVGDYVNGCRVHRIANCITIILDNEENISWVKPSDIKSIVTSQQFKAMKYKID